MLFISPYSMTQIPLHYIEQFDFLFRLVRKMPRRSVPNKMLSKCKYTSHARIVLSYKQEIIVQIQKLHLLCSLGKNIASNRDYTSSPPISNGVELWRKFYTLAGGWLCFCKFCRLQQWCNFAKNAYSTCIFCIWKILPPWCEIKKTVGLSEVKIINVSKL